MKTLRFLLAGAFALALIIALNPIPTPNPQTESQDQQPIDQLSALVIPLLKRGDTNTVAQINELLSAMEKQRSATEASFYVHVLTDLRSGKTNAAIELLETRLDGAVMTFSLRDSKYDKLLGRAKDYRSTYPHKSGSPEIDTAVARTFDSLPKKSE